MSYWNPTEDEKAYRSFRDEMEALEAAHGGAYIVDTVIDHENTMESDDWTTGKPLPMVEEEGEYWDMMLRQAISAAFYRCEELGFDLNEALGRVVF